MWFDKIFTWTLSCYTVEKSQHYLISIKKSLMYRKTNIGMELFLSKFWMTRSIVHLVQWNVQNVWLWFKCNYYIVSEHMKRDNVQKNCINRKLLLSIGSPSLPSQPPPNVPHPPPPSPLLWVTFKYRYLTEISSLQKVVASLATHFLWPVIAPFSPVGSDY